MSDRTLIFPAGSAIILTEGEYSDKGIAGTVVTLKECDLPALAKQYRAATNPEGKAYGDDISGFVSWLVANGWAFPAEVQEVHLGGYSTFTPSLVGELK